MDITLIVICSAVGLGACYAVMNMISVGYERRNRPPDIIPDENV